MGIPTSIRFFVCPCLVDFLAGNLIFARASEAGLWKAAVPLRWARRDGLSARPRERGALAD